MPFRVPWTEGTKDEGFVDAFCGYHRAQLATWTPEDWHLELVVFLDGDPVGAQGVFAHDYAATRTAATGSWLGRPFQDRGLGTEMRAAVLELLFRGLDAEAAVTAAFADNVQSQRVSEKLGYRRDGEELEPRHEYRYRLERELWRSPAPVELEGVESARPLFGG